MIICLKYNNKTIVETEVHNPLDNELFKINSSIDIVNYTKFLLENEDVSAKIYDEENDIERDRYIDAEDFSRDIRGLYKIGDWYLEHSKYQDSQYNENEIIDYIIHSYQEIAEKYNISFIVN